jgi:hypothetical protein
MVVPAMVTRCAGWRGVCEPYSRRTPKKMPSGVGSENSVMGWVSIRPDE